MDVLERIQQLLNEQGITPYELSKRSDVAESTVSNLLNRGSIPSIATLELLCHGLGITLSQFFADSGEPVILTDEQKRILKAVSSYAPETRSTIIRFIEELKHSFDSNK